ncbi:MAG TPA: LamG-like jellyroll fold domain-containing protein [Candidatus Kapabacteria bacterium]|nr:LamG-like jellyroll fold domain-containing protein [Candidatus Kapabacteria bacterium]
MILCIIGLAVSSYEARAQVPAGPILWLQADKGVVQQNGHVAIWQDQSGLGHDVRMDDTNSRPDLIVDSGRPAVIFHGWNYLQGPPIFPANADYTIAVVTKLNDSTAINNLVSGNTHALYFANDRYPRVVHTSFTYQEVSSVPVWPNGFSVITALYDQAYQYASLSVNGQEVDSSWVLSTSDSTLFIGSYSGGYFLQGEIEEVLLYNRELTPTERDSLDEYLMNRYGIAQSPPPPKPDSTFTLLPRPFQMYPRGADDSATVPIVGTIFSPGFDSVYVLQFKNGIPINRASQPLAYDGGRAHFAFSFRLHAELSEYRFEVHLLNGERDSIIASRDSIACGDIFLMDGQSNAYNGFIVDTFRNEYCRTFGYKWSQNLRDTMWHESGADVGAADQRIQQDLLAYAHIPSCSINEAMGGSSIELHEPNDSDRYDLRTIYGRELYRTLKSGMIGDVKAIFWLQGESNYAPGYYSKFLKLHQSWHRDFPYLQKIYSLQIRPNYCTWGNIDMRDVQRWMGDSLPDVEPIAAAALPFQDGCHYYDSGYRFMGDRFYLSLARDFYHASDTANLRSPNAILAWWTHSDHSQAAILFSPSDAQLNTTDDTTVDGIFATLKDYLYPNDTSSHVGSVSFDADTMFVNFDNPGKTQTLQYLPDQHYNSSDTAVYEGPWIVNQRGLGALLWYHLLIADSPFSDVTGGGEAAHHADFTITPDPASRSVTIDANEFRGPAQVTLLSETGATLWRKSLAVDHPDRVTFDLAGYASGCYLLHITNGRASAERKFILER